MVVVVSVYQSVRISSEKHVGGLRPRVPLEITATDLRQEVYWGRGESKRPSQSRDVRLTGRQGDKDIGRQGNRQAVTMEEI